MRGISQSLLPSIRRSRGLWAASLLLVVALGCRDKPSEPGTPPPAVRIASLTVSPAALALEAGGRATLSVDARDSSGTRITSPAITWRSDAPAVDRKSVV